MLALSDAFRDMEFKKVEEKALMSTIDNLSRHSKSNLDQELKNILK